MWTKHAYLVALVSISVLAANASAELDPPVGWWKFDHGTGSTAYDSSGNNFHGTISDNYTWIPGYIGPYALDFASGYVSISDESELRPNRLTVSVWVNLPGPQASYARLLVKGNDNSETYNFQLGGYGLNFIMNDGGGVALANPLWPDEWIHLGGVYDGNAMSLYVNGELDNSTTTGAFTPLQSGGPLSIAARAPNYDRRMMGSLDDVRIYDYGMTEAQIEELYFEIRDPTAAQWPFPLDMAEDVYPDVVLSWEPGLNVLSHEVYLGTDCNEVNDADTTWPIGTSVYKGSIDVNYYDPPGLLEFGSSYCWRIDEVAASGRVKGVVWSFTVDDGKAREPDPRDGGYAPLGTELSWTAAPLASLHDVYFGTDSAAVNSADEFSDEYKVSSSDPNYDPGPLSEATDYYWRIDEVIDGTTVKGDVWLFSTTGGLHLKVDLGLPQCFDGGAVVITDPPVAGTVKEGWWGFVASRWYDMYMHDAVWERGENGEGPPPDTNGIAGSGVHVALGCGGAGNGGFHVYNMCRDNLGGGGCPSGAPEGGAIANGWYHNVDWGGEKTGDVLMRINGLSSGEYVVVSYHNHWEPCSQGTRNCLNCYSLMPNMPSVTAHSLPTGSPPGYGQWTFEPGTGMGVTPIQDDYDIDVTSVTSDDEVSTSTIRFHTDGSDVLVIYDGGDNTYPDPARPGREGSKGILNAFEIIKVGEDPETAWNPFPADEADGVPRDVELSWSPGAGAISHDIYFGASHTAVSNATTSSPEYKGDQGAGSEAYEIPGPLDLGRTCYWRIDEITDTNILKGEVWSFTVIECLGVDDMESYCMGVGCTNQIYDTWIDNYINGTGSLIGLGFSPLPVHEGSQSMEFYYNNNFAMALYDYSETERTFTDPCNWAGAGLLTLYFYGDPGNDATSAEQMYVGLEDSNGPGSYAQVAYPNMGDIQVAEWQQWDVELSDFSSGGVYLGAVKKIYIGFGDRDNPVAGGLGTVYFDDIQLCSDASTCWEGSECYLCPVDRSRMLRRLHSRRLHQSGRPVCTQGRLRHAGVQPLNRKPELSIGLRSGQRR
ncbi:MAG: LamG domain-containing protein [Planctomycetota bacterium]|jgi:hypothetical protein